MKSIEIDIEGTPPTSEQIALVELYDRLNFGGTPHTPEQRGAFIRERMEHVRAHENR